MADTVGILLDDTLDLLISGDTFVNGDATMSEVGVVLTLNRGQLKSDPLIGPNLLSLTRSVQGRRKAATLAKLHLERDGKSYEQIKEQIQIGDGQG